MLTACPTVVFEPDPEGDAGSDSGGTDTGGTVGDNFGGAGTTGGTLSAGTSGSTSVEPTLVISGQDDYWHEGEVIEAAGSNATITVNTNRTYQRWYGFGGTFSEAGWDALQALSEADRALAISLLFDVTDGIGLSWGRIPIGANDYARDRYTLDDHAGDTSMSQFSIDRDRLALIPYIKAAQAAKSDIQFWASPWTPPPWMKEGGENGGYDGGAMKSDAVFMNAMALYIVRFVQAYASEGIPIDYVAPQNEPGYAAGYPSCAWGPSTDDNVTTNRPVTLGTFVEQYLAPAFTAANLETKIWYGPFGNRDTFYSYWWGLSEAGRQVLAGVALQWGTQTFVREIAAPGFLVMQSEHQCGNYPWLESLASSPADANRDSFLSTMAPNNHAYGEESWDLIKAWIEAGVNIYSAWHMVLDTEGFNLDQSRRWPQNALLAVDTSAKTLKVTPAYYVFRHVGQYVDPGAVRVGVTGGNALAFKNPDGSIVTAMYYSGSSPSQTTLGVDGHTLSFQIPARGWATVNWQGN